MSPKIPDLTERLQFRLTPAEKTALEKLAARQAADMEAAGYPPDPSLGGFLRAMIRKLAAEHKIPLDASPAPAPAPAPKGRATKGGRS